MFYRFIALLDFVRTTRVSRYQKGKTSKVKPNLDLLEHEIVSGSGISWTVCKSAPWPRHNHVSIPPLKFFTGRMPFLPPNQQRQSTEGKSTVQIYMYQGRKSLSGSSDTGHQTRSMMGSTPTAQLLRHRSWIFSRFIYAHAFAEAISSASTSTCENHVQPFTLLFFALLMNISAFGPVVSSRI